MNSAKKISSALISVYHKDRLEPIIRRLHELGVTLYATGGTQTFIEQAGLPVVPVEDLTGYPSILGGRVKTLHPAVFGGILNRRDNPSDSSELLEYSIPHIDLVVVDLYPFEETVASGATEKDIIEKIDIGGISLIRAAAKNWQDVLIIPSREHYTNLSEILFEKEGKCTSEERRLMAGHAFNISSHYDTKIFQYFNQDSSIAVFKQSIQSPNVLRYGENPHQKGVFYGELNQCFEKLNGKEISYNNLLDIDAVIALSKEFTEPTVIIVKHNNACGLASRSDISQAWDDALAGDPVSAFGGVISVNRPVDDALAKKINELFFEILIAPSYSADALSIISQKKNRIILLEKNIQYPEKQFRSILNGVLEQDRDTSTETRSTMKVITVKSPEEDQFADLEFANKIVKHTKSNTIVLAKNRQLIGSGTGQTSRIDALRQAIEKAKTFQFDLQGAVMASDAFFPFPDCVEIAGKAGITAVIQPGGSIKDQQSVDYCNANNIAMVMTGVRHFKH
jgi:phosphoribosylaminoimidazolecarboxamide formyltransferase / IMP cyclohydrolase